MTDKHQRPCHCSVCQREWVWWRLCSELELNAYPLPRSSCPKKKNMGRNIRRRVCVPSIHAYTKYLSRHRDHTFTCSLLFTLKSMKEGKGNAPATWKWPHTPTQLLPCLDAGVPRWQCACMNLIWQEFNCCIRIMLTVLGNHARRIVDGRRTEFGGWWSHNAWYPVAPLQPQKTWITRNWDN